jgi:hypothetical protein
MRSMRTVICSGRWVWLSALLLLPWNGWAFFTLEFTNTSAASVVNSSQLTVTIGGTNFFAFQNIHNGAGTVTSAVGSTSLQGTAPGDVTFTYGDLEQVAFSNPAGTTTQEYGEGDASQNFIQLFLSGNLIASGVYESLTIVTDSNPSSSNLGLATGMGSVLLTAPGADPSFYNEVLSLTGGRMQFIVDQFIATAFVENQDPNLVTADFATTGRFEVIPEPSTAMLLLTGLLPLIAAFRRT